MKRTATIGQRLWAAVFSYQLGIGMDYALRNYAPAAEDLNPLWEEIGCNLQKALADAAEQTVKVAKVQ